MWTLFRLNAQDAFISSIKWRDNEMHFRHVVPCIHIKTRFGAEEMVRMFLLICRF